MLNIAIHSAPRSGSSWLGTLFNAHPNIVYKFQPLFSYEFKNALDENSPKEEISLFFEKIATCKSDFLDQSEEKKRLISPNFKKETIKAILYKEVRYIFDCHLYYDSQVSEFSSIDRQIDHIF